MRNKAYRNLNISFIMENYSVKIINLLWGQFNRSVPTHSHANNCYEIHLISSGYGQLAVDDITYDLLPTSLFLTGPKVGHEQIPVFPDSMAEYCIYLEVKKLSGKKTSIIDRFAANPFQLGFDNGKILTLMQEMFAELDTKPLGYQKQVELLCSMTLLEMARCFEQGSPLLEPQPAAAISEYARTTLIEDSFMGNYQNLSLTSLAESLHLSRRQTERLIQKLYNKTFHEKKLEARMSAASLMLKDSTMSITAIAEAAGFSSQEYFSNSFKKYFGVSPRQYRLTHHQTSTSS